MESSVEHDILLAYTRGQLWRAATMKSLGITWYGELLDLLAKHNLQLRVDPAREEEMVAKAIELLKDHA